MKRAGGEKSEHYRRWQTIFNKSITVRLYEFVQHSRGAVRLFSVSDHSNKNSIVILVFAFFLFLSLFLYKDFWEKHAAFQVLRCTFAVIGDSRLDDLCSLPAARTSRFHGHRQSH